MEFFKLAKILILQICRVIFSSGPNGSAFCSNSECLSMLENLLLIGLRILHDRMCVVMTQRSFNTIYAITQNGHCFFSKLLIIYINVCNIIYILFSPISFHSSLLFVRIFSIIFIVGNVVAGYKTTKIIFISFILCLLKRASLRETNLMPIWQFL